MPPANFLQAPAAIRKAILYHELMHVRRRDWLWSIIEECVGVLLWFHPAVWWLQGQIRLNREQSVDREVVGLIGGRREYAEAPLSIAGSRLINDLTPAPLFSRKRHLARRVALLLQEVHMVKRRLVCAFQLAVPLSL